jgi:hypothetical protein
LESDTVLKAALNSQQTYYGSPDLQSENQALFPRLGRIRPQRVLTVPLKVRSKTAALIYADSAERGEVSINVEAIELLAHTAGLVVELVSLRARMSEAVEQAKQTSAAPVTAPPPVPAAERVTETTSTFGSGPPPQTHPTAPDFLAQREHSGDLRPPSPAPTYFRTTTEPDFPPQGAGSGPSTNGAPVEEEKAHNDARRFARLLVSEIKLYNEQKVAEGRRGGDLYDRLKEDIDRSRQMYEKRVTPNVAARFDYFYDELVSTLAEGDPSKLGSDCPGPSVVATTS